MLSLQQTATEAHNYGAHIVLENQGFEAFMTLRHADGKASMLSFAKIIERLSSLAGSQDADSFLAIIMLYVARHRCRHATLTTTAFDLRATDPSKMPILITVGCDQDGQRLLLKSSMTSDPNDGQLIGVSEACTTPVDKSESLGLLDSLLSTDENYAECVRKILVEEGSEGLLQSVYQQLTFHGVKENVVLN